MLSTLRRALQDDLEISVAESSAMALAKEDSLYAAQAGSPLNSIVAPISMFSEYLLDFQTTAQSLTSTLYGELEAIFSRVDLHDISPLHTAPQTTSPSSYDSHRPAYIEPAYKWLLANIHNPYPSKEARAKIARKAKSDTKSVEAWFIDARKRIGWNTLRKRHFENKRFDIVDAATCFFVQFDGKRPLGPVLEHEFAQLEISTKNLYAEKFEESDIATQFDVAFKDLTPQMKIEAREEVARRREAAAEAYPSPLRSPDRSPEPANFSPLEQDADLATTPLNAITGRKRRSLSPEGDGVAADRPSKRTRVESPPAVCLPSPTPSRHELLPKSPSPPPSATNTIPLPAISRKRRLSDTDSQSAPKRPRHLPAGPRLQTVSDPLPIMSTAFQELDVDNWFDTNFGTHRLASVDPLNDPEWDLDVYTYSTPDANTPSTAIESLGYVSPVAQCVDLTPPLADDDVHTIGLEISTNDFNYNELFNNYEQPILVPSDFICQIDNLQEVQPSLEDFSFLTNLPTAPSFHPYNLDPVANPPPPAITDDLTNLDWDFTSFEPLVGSFNTNLLQDLNRSDVSQGVSLSTGTFSFLNPLSPSPSISQAPCRDGKAEIQMRLAEMKEEMKRLEEQIAQSS